LPPVILVVCGATCSMAVDTNGKLFSWGNNNDCQLGHPDYKNKYVPTPLSNDAFHGDAVESLSAGSYHAAAITKTGNLYLWGSNSTGQLGMNQSLETNKPCILPPFQESPPSIVCCSVGHTMVVFHNGELYTFGEKQAALGHTNTDGIPTRVDPKHFDNVNVVSVACAQHHSAAVTSDGKLYTWGVSNALGHGDINKIWIPTQVAPTLLGDKLVGSFRGLLPEHALAFVMCQHKRLGEGSMYMEFDGGIIKLIIELCAYRPWGILRTMPRVVRLQGGT